VPSLPVAGPRQHRRVPAPYSVECSAPCLACLEYKARVLPYIAPRPGHHPDPQKRQRQDNSVTLPLVRAPASPLVLDRCCLAVLSSCPGSPSSSSSSSLFLARAPRYHTLSFLQLHSLSPSVGALRFSAQNSRRRYCAPLPESLICCCGAKHRTLFILSRPCLLGLPCLLASPHLVLPAPSGCAP